jgi:predicted benzoate:H+ symporter BenE
MTTKLLWLLAVVLLAFVLRWLLPSDTGFTVYLAQHTRYISLNVVAFWATLVIALVVGMVVLLVQYRRL